MSGTTIEDVAQRAGVSSATASRALRGLPTVTPSTRDHVVRIALEMQYKVDPSLTRKVDGYRSVAVVMPHSDQWFYAKVGGAIEMPLLTEGVQVMRYSIISLEHLHQLIERLVKSHAVDGIITVSLALPDELRTRIAEANIAIATVETQMPNTPGVAIDNVKASAIAVRHLINLGHQDIAFIGELEDDPFEFPIPVARRAGYHEALRAYGIALRPDYERGGNFSYEGGAEAVKQLYTLYKPPTAVFAISGEMAIGAWSAARQMGLNVPGDLSILSFDGNDVGEHLGLTCVRQPITEYGELTAKLIQAQWQGDTLTDEIHLLEPQLVIRNSTAVARPLETSQDS